MTDGARMVGIGEFAISGPRERLVIYGLGSCAALVVYDPDSRRAGLAHVLLPGRAPGDKRSEELPAKFAVDALDLLLEGLGSPPGVRAAVVGGAHLFLNEGAAEKSVGARNVASLREALAGREIPLVWEDTGGEVGRTVAVELPGCILSVKTLRGGWTASHRLG